MAVSASRNIPVSASLIEPPPDLPAFAALAVSYPSEPLPALLTEETLLLSAATVPARWEAFARGRAAAHAALQSLELDAGPILSGPNREPLWPAGATGSITHVAGVGVALVAPRTATDGVGVDLEQLRNVPELREQVPTPEEATWIERLERSERQAALTALFSAKESVFKAFFPRIGSFFGFESAVLSPAADGFVGRLAVGLDPGYPPERTFAVTSQWFGDLVLTSLVLPKTAGPVATGPDLLSNDMEFSE